MHSAPFETERGFEGLAALAKLGTPAFFAAALATAAPPQPIDPVSVLGVKNGLLETAVTDAVSNALEMLSTARCQRIFTDFRDTAGAPLQSKLDGSGYSAPGFLEILRFANGERLDACQRARVLAATVPNSHVIYLCGARFFDNQRSNPEFSAVLVIHEMLHSLGLGENPPSSLDITARVLERCGPPR